MNRLFAGMTSVLFLAGLCGAATVTAYLNPDSMAGFSQWGNSRCNTANEYLCVSEGRPANAANSLLAYTRFSQKKEIMGLQNLACANASAYVYSVSLNYYAKHLNITSGSNTGLYDSFVPVLKTNGIEFSDAYTRVGVVDVWLPQFALPLTTVKSYRYYNLTFFTNPATSAPFTLAEVNALQFGMRTNSSAAFSGSQVAQADVSVAYNNDGC